MDKCHFLRKLNSDNFKCIDWGNSPISIQVKVILPTVLLGPSVAVFQTRKLFWSMINNLGLNRMDDESYDSFEVEDRLDIFMNREYKPDGTGGLFKLRKTRHDLRNVEIWYQMMWYLSENM